MDQPNNQQDADKYKYPYFQASINNWQNDGQKEKQYQDIPVGHPIGQPQVQQFGQQVPNQVFQYPQQNYPYINQPTPFQVIQVFPQGDLSQSNSQSYFCQTCRNLIQTRVELSIGYGQCICSLIICVLGGFFGCCLLPFCFDSCKDVTHMCPQCGTYLGKTPFLGRKRFY